MYRGKSPKPPRTPELALYEIVTESEAWVRRYEEAWFNVPVKLMGEKIPVLDAASSVFGKSCQAWLPEALRTTLLLAETAMEAHETLKEWDEVLKANEAQELKTSKAKQKPAKKTSRCKQ